MTEQEKTINDAGKSTNAESCQLDTVFVHCTFCKHEGQLHYTRLGDYKQDEKKERDFRVYQLLQSSNSYWGSISTMVMSCPKCRIVQVCPPKLFKK